MMSSVKGYYDGERIVTNEDVNLVEGQELIITILVVPVVTPKKIDLKKYVGRGEKMFSTDAQDYIKEMRNDRDT